MRGDELAQVSSDWHSNAEIWPGIKSVEKPFKKNPNERRKTSFTNSVTDDSSYSNLENVDCWKNSNK